MHKDQIDKAFDALKTEHGIAPDILESLDASRAEAKQVSKFFRTMMFAANSLMIAIGGVFVFVGILLLKAGDIIWGFLALIAGSVGAFYFCLVLVRHYRAYQAIQSFVELKYGRDA